MTDEKLIEEAAKAIQDVARERVPGIVIGERAAQTTHEYARAALAVFEHAGPYAEDEQPETEIERILDEAGYDVLEPWRADVVHLMAEWSAGFRRSEVRHD